jgi:phosphoglycolate phosphatase
MDEDAAPVQDCRTLLAGTASASRLEVQAWRPTFKLSQNKDAGRTRTGCRWGWIRRVRPPIAQLMRTWSRTVRLAVFDCDGTLIDGQAAICEAMEAPLPRVSACRLAARGDVRRAVGLSPAAGHRAGCCPMRPELLRGTDRRAYKRGVPRRARARGSCRSRCTKASPMLACASSAPAGSWASPPGMSRARDWSIAWPVQRPFAACSSRSRRPTSHPSKPHPAMLEAALPEAGMRTRRGTR